MTKTKQNRNKQLKQYLKKLQEHDWHKPATYNNKIATRPIKDLVDYYNAQMVLILRNNFHQSLENVASILDIPKVQVFRLSERYEQEFDSIEEIQEAIQNG